MMHHCANEFNVVFKLLKGAAQEEKVLLDFENQVILEFSNLPEVRKQKGHEKLPNFYTWVFFLKTTYSQNVER